MEKEVNIAILGLGNVGGGVYRILSESRNLIESRLFRDLQEEVKIDLKWIFEKRKPVQKELHSIFTSNFEDVLKDKSVDIVIETMGWVEPTTEYVKKLLIAKKNVISANKEMIAKAQGELEELARQNGVKFLYEASVAGTIPVLQGIRDGLVANEFKSIRGIVNGTTNYILSTMYEEGKTFDEALKKAQELGFAEKDPANDVDGFDAMYKLAILCYTAFGEYPKLESIVRESLRNVSIEEIESTKKEGAKLKYVADAKKLANGELDLSVKLTRVKPDDVLFDIDGVLNGVALECDRAGSVFFSGAGAGSEPTASAIISDLVKVIEAVV